MESVDDLNKPLDVGKTPRRPASSFKDGLEMSVGILKAVLVLGGLFIVAPVLLFFGLRWLAHPLIRRSQASSLGAAIAPAGYVLYGCQVLYLLVCVVAYHLDPTGWPGAVLHTSAGIAGAVAIAVVGFNVAASDLARAGYPPFRRGARRDV